MGLIRGFERFNFVVVKFNIERANRLFDVFDGSRSHDRGGNFRLGQNPRQSLLRH